MLPYYLALGFQLFAGLHAQRQPRLPQIPCVSIIAESQEIYVPLFDTSGSSAGAFLTGILQPTSWYSPTLISSRRQHQYKSIRSQFRSAVLHKPPGSRTRPRLGAVHPRFRCRNNTLLTKAAVILPT